MFYAQLIFKTLPHLVSVLSNSFLSALVLYVQFISFLISKKLSKNLVGWKFDFSYEGKEFQIKLFEGSPDVAALSEIFLDGEYSWVEIKNPQIIVDLGAHTGNTALYFRLKYPDAIVYAVEASPLNFSRLTENTKHDSKIIPIFGAVSDNDGVMTFYESTSSLGSSTQRRGVEDSAIVVPCFTLHTLFEQHKLSVVDFMKIDIEGSEGKIFTKLSPETFAYSYIIEVHNDLMDKDIDFTKKYFSGYKTVIKPLKNKDRYLLYAD